MVGVGWPACSRLRWFLPFLLVPSWSTGAVLAHTTTLAPDDVDMPAGLVSLVHRPTFRRRPMGSRRACPARGPAGLVTLPARRPWCPGFTPPLSPAGLGVPAALVRLAGPPAYQPSRWEGTTDPGIQVPHVRP